MVPQERAVVALELPVQQGSSKDAVVWMDRAPPLAIAGLVAAGPEGKGPLTGVGVLERP